MYLPLTSANIEIAVSVIKNGGLVAFPTETVYGLGADALNTKALAKIFETKRRPFFDPLIIHIAELASLQKIIDYKALGDVQKDMLLKISGLLWPGPLTLVLPKLSIVPDLATAGLPSVAVRFPNHDGALELIRKSTGLIAAPSANPFGYLSPTLAEHVRDQLGGMVDIILDGGRTGIGVESTVLDLTHNAPRILRQGGTTQEQIEAVTGSIAHNTGTSRASPGLLKSHYAPHTPLFLYTAEEMTSLDVHADKTEVFLFFDKATFDKWAARNKTYDIQNIFILSETGSEYEAASNLFETLHIIDKLHVSAINAQKCRESGLGRAINDRLKKASAANMHPDMMFITKK
ncbi:tRNA threonylcarbamoyladenosine biosynthesis protein [Spirochaetia bacterium]|nr:tRNA threonylcarbamoyladenosine biosynthesis protein [Spirochaetia bacterium]